MKRFERVVGMLEEAVGKLTILTDGEVTVADLRESIDARGQLSHLHARLTASETQVKRQGDVLAYLLDCGPDIVQAVQEAKSDLSEDYGEEQRQERDALREQVKALQQAQRWTTEKPTVAGFYWFRKDRKKRVVELEFESDGETLAAEGWRLIANYWNGEWQGPLTPGEE